MSRKRKKVDRVTDKIPVWRGCRSKQASRKAARSADQRSSSAQRFDGLLFIQLRQCQPLIAAVYCQFCRTVFVRLSGARRGLLGHPKIILVSALIHRARAPPVIKTSSPLGHIDHWKLHKQPSRSLLYPSCVFRCIMSSYLRGRISLHHGCRDV
jgi:hypothetical protein